MEGWKKMCLYKFTHIPLLKSDALLKNNNKKKPKKQSPKFIRKKIISRKKKKKKILSKENTKTKNHKRRRRKKKRKRQQIGQAHVQVHMSIFVIYLSNSSHSVFSPFWREHFGGPGDKTPRLHQFPPPPPLPPTKHPPKKFSFPFSLQSFPSTLFYHQTNTP